MKRTKTYKSLFEFYRETEAGTGAKAGKHQKSVYNFLEKMNRPDFTGATKAEILSRKFAWPDGARAISELPGIDEINSGSRFISVWSEDDGDAMDMERYYTGDKFLKRRIRKAGNNSGKFATVYINISERADVPQTAMLWKCKAAIKLIDELESAGIRTQIYIIAETVGGINRSRDTIETKVLIKKYEDNLNLALIATAAAPWTYRKWFFQNWSSRANMSRSMGRGKPTERAEISKDNQEDLIYIINRGECWNQEAAAKWLKKSAEQTN